ncbi:MAG: hypothetical protein M0R33_22335 [Methylomonas sp.]|jgi:hypothetical protein|uniref:hypothetical protein n=1 Tax=Methylomonas sp. TaxID=418 RepID=UPI002600894F|nr:hypothetical protein [Methylomonas sp.]MCK9609183.1 hypothetical protein [Methylomonas sp.]
MDKVDGIRVKINQLKVHGCLLLFAVFCAFSLKKICKLWQIIGENGKERALLI